MPCVKPVTNVKNVASNLPVGARLQNFWQTWLDLGAGLKVVQILKEGYTLPFPTRPKLTRSPTVISCSVNPHRNLYLLEALHQLIDKNAVELVQIPDISGIFQPTIFNPKAQQVETYIRSEQSESFPQGGEIQDGDTGNHQDIPPTRGVGQWWLEEGNVLTGQPLHPIKHALQIFTDASKEWWGVHLNEHTARGSWSLPKSKLHINCLELKAVFLALKEFQDLCSDKIVLVATDNTTVVSYINKEGGMRSGPLCALNFEQVYQETSNTQGPTHSRPTERGSRQAIQARPDHSDRVVSPSRGLLRNIQQVAPASNRPIHHQIQQQVASFCITGTGSPGHSSGCTVCHGRSWTHMPFHQQPCWAK